MNYISQIIKSNRNKKRFLVINILGLSICFSAALLILMFITFELSYDRFHDDERVYRVESRLYEGDILSDNWATTTFGHGSVMSEEIPGIESFVRITTQNNEQVVSNDVNKFFERSYCYTEPSFFEIFNFPMIKGNNKDQLKKPFTVVISESTARKYFGNSDPLGEVLTFRTSKSEQNFEVTGVIADMPLNSHIHFDFLLSYSSIPKSQQDIWYIHGVYTYVKLKSGQDPHNIESAFRSISSKYKTAELKFKDWRVELIPLKDIHLIPQKSYEKEKKGNITAIYILLVMAVALLIIAWMNSFNLTVARSLERSKEFGVRKVFGASRKQILFMGLLESAIINTVAAIIGLGWLEIFFPVVVNWAGYDFGLDSIRQPLFWIIVFSIISVGTLITGFYPSYRLMILKTSDVIKGNLVHTQKGNIIRNSLIVIQFVASFVLISGTFIIIRQVNFMQEETASASKSKILIVKYPSYVNDLQVKIESFKNQLKKDFSIRHVSVSGAVPGIEVANFFGNRPFGSDPSEVKLIQMFAIDKEYLSIYFPELICGRVFSDEYGDELNNVVLNEEAVSMFGFAPKENALGKQLTMEVLNEPLNIVGVVKNFYQQSLAVPYKPIIFFLKERVPFIATPYISIQSEKNLDVNMLENIEKIYMEYFPTSLFSYYFLDDFYNSQYKEDRNFGLIFAGSAILAVFVACMGLWIITLFSTLSRVKEIGIRKVLGASKMTLFILLTKELFFLTIIASCLGIPVSIFLMNSWLSQYAFHTSISFWVYIGTFLLLILIALVTIVNQILITIRLKPMSVLKNE